METALDYFLPTSLLHDLQWDWAEVDLNWPAFTSYMNAHMLESQFFHYQVQRYHTVMENPACSYCIIVWRRFQ
jgi:hypothetical protein